MRSGSDIETSKLIPILISWNLKLNPGYLKKGSEKGSEANK